MGYPLTIISKDRQKHLYKSYYDKNYTTENDPDISKPAPTSLLNKIMIVMGNHSSCAKSIRKLFCADVIPPCFENEGLAFYTVCRNVCTSIGAQCPKVIESNLGYFLYCERMAVGNTTLRNGYCKHTSWPPPMKWLDVFQGKTVIY
jgi:hypothetical protein